MNIELFSIWMIKVGLEECCLNWTILKVSSAPKDWRMSANFNSTTKIDTIDRFYIISCGIAWFS